MINQNNNHTSLHDVHPNQCLITASINKLRHTFSRKKEQWKWEVLPDMDSRCRLAWESRLWTITWAVCGIPTGLKQQSNTPSLTESKD